jgi:hypothetical protein
MSALPSHAHAGAANAAPNRGPNCWQCRFFGVSHIPATPYACRAMGFQSKILPSIEVLRADGEFCRSFQPKAPVNGANAGLALTS